MTSVNRTQGAGPIWPNNNGGNSIHKKNAGDVKLKGFVQITSNNSFARADLDGISPYAAMGVDLSATKANDISARTQKEAEAMFPKHTGYYALSDSKEANYDLADINFKLQARTPEGVEKYVDAHTNRAMAEKHLADGSYANFLEQLDAVFG